MKQIEKDQKVVIRIGSKVLLGDAKEVITTQVPRFGTITDPPLTRFLGVVDVKDAAGKVVSLAHRRVVCPGKLALAADPTQVLTVLPTTEMFAQV